MQWYIILYHLYIICKHLPPLACTYLLVLFPGTLQSRTVCRHHHSSASRSPGTAAHPGRCTVLLYLAQLPCHTPTRLQTCLHVGSIGCHSHGTCGEGGREGEREREREREIGTRLVWLQYVSMAAGVLHSILHAPNIFGSSGKRILASPLHSGDRSKMCLVKIISRVVPRELPSTTNTDG